jgi:hypothetical protein
VGKFIEARDQLVNQLEDADLKVTLRLEDVDPPCVWPLVFDYDHGYLGGGGELRFRLHLIVPATDDERVLEDLEAMLDALIAAGIQPSENTTLVGVRTPEHPDPFPAFQVTTSLTIG